ncbi:hypothetical protein GO986_11930 [Deinococcus sp. HMF7620]|uniref:Uncharacterized protein n=1 Tax=Deinococcus arboris TaxID=2682977 RepID=A0A7C9LMN7_9DEIO|nr:MULTISPECIES: hypothetical protein [Deinococcus]MBZ9752171.1 hypothetical protein [Deinococcus betulae]MVN87477.1 hypothetical protein [Deinococcus arboris]
MSDLNTAAGSPLIPDVALRFMRLQEQAESVQGWLSAEDNAQRLSLLATAPGIWRGFTPAVQFTVMQIEQRIGPDPLLHFLAAAGQPPTLVDDWPSHLMPEAGYVVTRRWLNPERSIGLYHTYRAAVERIHRSTNQPEPI